MAMKKKSSPYITPEGIAQLGLNPLNMRVVHNLYGSANEEEIKVVVAKLRKKEKVRMKRAELSTANDKSEQDHEEEPVVESIFDVPDENEYYGGPIAYSTTSHGTELDRLATWLEFHSTPKNRKGLGFYYPIVDDNDNSILEETRKRCEETALNREASNQPNIAKSGKGKGGRIKKRKKNRALTATVNALDVTDPYSRTLRRSFVERHRIDQLLSSLGYEYQDLSGHDTMVIQKLEQHIDNAPAVTRPVMEHGTFTSEYTSELDSDNQPDTADSTIFSIDREAQEQRWYDNRLSGAAPYLPNPLEELQQMIRNNTSQHLIRYRGSVGKGNTLEGVSDSYGYYYFLTQRTKPDANRREREAAYLDSQDPLGNRRSDAGRYVHPPWQYAGVAMSSFMKSRRNEWISQGKIWPINSFANWNAYVSAKQEARGRIKNLAIRMINKRLKGSPFCRWVYDVEEPVLLEVSKRKRWIRTRTLENWDKFVVWECMDNGSVNYYVYADHYDMPVQEWNSRDKPKCTYSEWERSLGLSAPSEASPNDVTSGDLYDKHVRDYYYRDTTEAEISQSMRTEAVNDSEYKDNVVSLDKVKEDRAAKLNGILSNITSNITFSMEKFKSMSYHEQDAFIDDLVEYLEAHR